MQLEAGKSYRARCGDVYGPMFRRSDDTYPFKDDDGMTWTDTGRYRYEADVIHDLDLIEEVPTAVNPELLPCPKCNSRNTGYAKSDWRKQRCADCNTSWTHGGPSQEPTTLGDQPAPEPSGTLPTLHTADPFEAIEWAERELEKRRLDLNWTVTRLIVPRVDPVPGPAEGA